MVSTIDEARTPAELAEWLRVWADGYEEGVDYLDDNDARQLAVAVERVCQIGNAAALREALNDACHAMFEFLKRQNGGFSDMANALDKGKAALAAPARNADRFATAEEAYAAWMPAVEMDAICDWLFAPAKEGKEARRG